MSGIWENSPVIGSWMTGAVYCCCFLSGEEEVLKAVARRAWEGVVGRAFRRRTELRRERAAGRDMAMEECEDDRQG
jgi:hypothetical protein